MGSLTMTTPHETPWCYVFGGGQPQAGYIKAIKDLEYRVVLFDKNKRCAAADLADVFVHTAYDDYYGQGQWLRTWKRSTEDDVIFTAADHQAWESACVMSQRLRIPYLPPERAVRVLDRTVFYEYCALAKVNVPYWEVWTGHRPKSFDALAYWVKADYGCANKHVHRMTAVELFQNRKPYMPRETDRHYRRVAIIQAEMQGVHFNVNLWPNGDMWFMKDGKRQVSFPKARPDINAALRELQASMGITSLITKFHVIANDKTWAVIDARLDPPNLMRKAFENMGRDFCKAYVAYYLRNDPTLLRAGAI